MIWPSRDKIWIESLNARIVVRFWCSANKSYRLSWAVDCSYSCISLGLSLPHSANQRLTENFNNGCTSSEIELCNTMEEKVLKVEPCEHFQSPLWPCKHFVREYEHRLVPWSCMVCFMSRCRPTRACAYYLHNKFLSSKGNTNHPFHISHLATELTVILHSFTFPEVGRLIVTESLGNKPFAARILPAVQTSPAWFRKLFLKWKQLARCHWSWLRGAQQIRVKTFFDCAREISEACAAASIDSRWRGFPGLKFCCGQSPRSLQSPESFRTSKIHMDRQDCFVSSLRNRHASSSIPKYNDVLLHEESTRVQT